MQFTRTAVLVALAALVAVAVASPVENSIELSAAGLETRAPSTVAQVASVQQHASTDYQRLHTELTKLNADSVSIEQLRPVVDRITATTKSAADELNKLSEQAKNEKRQVRPVCCAQGGVCMLILCCLSPGPPRACH